MSTTEILIIMFSDASHIANEGMYQSAGSKSQASVSFTARNHGVARDIPWPGRVDCLIITPSVNLPVYEMREPGRTCSDGGPGKHVGRIMYTEMHPGIGNRAGVSIGRYDDVPFRVLECQCRCG